MSATHKLTKEDLVSAFYEAYENDPSGKLCAKVSDELAEEDDVSPEDLLKSQQEASRLYAKYAY